MHKYKVNLFTLFGWVAIWNRENKTFFVSSVFQYFSFFFFFYPQSLSWKLPQSFKFVAAATIDFYELKKLNTTSPKAKCY